MTDPWLSIIGIGEDGVKGLSDASRSALEGAEVVFGGPRHLRLAAIGERGRPWPIPFSVKPVLDLRGRNVAVLASGNPFWYGAGGTLADCLRASEWRAFPAPSTFAIAAARLGWRLEETHCVGLHAAPFERLLPHLGLGQRVVCLMRDAAAVTALAQWLDQRSFGKSTLWVMEARGGPNERIQSVHAADLAFNDMRAPVALAIEVAGGAGRQRSSGLPDDAFAHDGQITKRAIRAVTLSSLAPRHGEHLWDIGGGSGSVSIEWALAGGTATTIEPKAERAEIIRTNAAQFGVTEAVKVVEGRAPEALKDLSHADAVFIGGGASDALLEKLWSVLSPGTRLVANAVTLESESLIASWHARYGGSLMRIEIAEVQPLGQKRGWVSARPVTQWSVTR